MRNVEKWWEVVEKEEIGRNWCKMRILVKINEKVRKTEEIERKRLKPTRRMKMSENWENVRKLTESVNDWLNLIQKEKNGVNLN